MIWGTWFRMMRQGDLSKLARIQVDIPNTLDDLWTLDIKKSAAIPPAEVRKNLEVIIDKIAERSKKTWTFRGKKEVSESTVHIWNRMKNIHGGIYYEINREHPIVKQIVSRDETIGKQLIAMLQQIERGLPLNQLYVDLNNDEQLRNDQIQEEADISAALYSMLESMHDAAEKSAFLDTMSGIEPFCAYAQIIDKIRKEILV